MFLKVSDDIKLIAYIVFGIATSIAPTVLLMYGIAQFSIVRIVGEESVTKNFAIAYGIVSFTIIFLTPLGGYISDKTKSYTGDRRFWIIMGSILGFLGMLWFSLSSTILELIVSWVIVTFSYGLVTLSYYALIPDNFKNDTFGKVSGIIGSMVPLVIMVISVIIMGYFSSLFLMWKIIIISSIQLLANIFIVFVLDFSNGKNNEHKKTNHRYLYPNIKKYPDFTWVLLSRLCINFVSAGLSMMPIFYMTRFDLSEERIFQINAISSAGVLLMVVFGISSGYLSDKLQMKKPFIITSSLIVVICMLIYSTSYSIFVVIIISFIYQSASGVFNSVDMALVNHVLPSKSNYAKDIAIMNTTIHIAKSIMSFISPLILSLGIMWMGDDGYTLFFLILSFFSLLAGLFVIPVSEKSNKY